jgi:flagellar biosynthetic protein FliQ
MSSDAAVEVVRQAILLALLVASPLLLASLLVGVTVSLVQSITQIQEQTLTFIPKILAIGAVLIILFPWILNRLIEYLHGSISSMSLTAF